MYLLDTSAKAAQLNRIDIVSIKRKLLFRVEDRINNIAGFLPLEKRREKTSRKFYCIFETFCGIPKRRSFEIERIVGWVCSCMRASRSNILFPHWTCSLIVSPE